MIAALVKGLYLSIKRRFIDINGIEFIVQMLRTETDQSLRKKALSVLDDFVLYDKDLGGPETLLMVEQDREILKGKASSHLSLKDPKATPSEEQTLATHLLTPQNNSAYLHITKRSLFNSTFLEDLCGQLSSSSNFKASTDEDCWSTYFRLAKLTILYGKLNHLQSSISLQVV